MKMMKSVLLTGVLLVLTASMASAVGLDMGYAIAGENTCPSSVQSTLNHTFACTANTGAAVLVGSFVAPPGLNSVTSEEMFVDVQVHDVGGSLPPWWHSRSVWSDRRSRSSRRSCPSACPAWAP